MKTLSLFLGIALIIGLMVGPAFSQDSDGDGIPDDEDACFDSDLSETVVIGGCDSGVFNTLLPTGCTISDLVTEAFVTGGEEALEDKLEAYEDQGILTEDQAEDIEDCAEDLENDD